MNIRLPKVGDHVNIIEKRNYESGQLTTGIVRRTLSNPHEVHPRGNKVELEDGTVGRMVSFVDEVGIQPSVDPALREELTREIRNQNSEIRIQTSDKGQGGESRGPRTENRDQRADNREPRRDFRNRPPEGYDQRDQRQSPPPEPPVKVSDLPGEDDLR